MTQKKSIFQPVRPDINIPKLEEGVLATWNENKIFEKSLKQTQDAEFYSFYDGPPFATGLPHYGHLVPSILKDIVPRYWTMRGYHVPRRWGWDCHGLPVEYEINKSMGLESRKEVLKLGVKKYNDACRGIVDRYTQEWKSTIERVGRWVEMDHPYRTMDTSYMESVWWVFRQLWDKGLIYQDYKVVPYSVGVSTPLSNFEANLNYKDVQDPSITIRFKVLGEENSYFIAWTTTPWTLPSNLGLAVGEDLDYVQVFDPQDNCNYILAESLLDSNFKNADSLEKKKTFKGKDLANLKYEPLFPYFADKKDEGAFKVILSEHVTLEAGTGIVHMAPAFGEDDYYACKKVGIPVVNPVDDDGMFTAEVSDYQGKRVKDADKEIIARLKKEGKLIRQETLTHSYPFCWRSDTPLIYKAVSTWFVGVEKIKEKIIANNKKTNWVPDNLRDGRFGKWLENARDWAVSRNRFWGTPIPVWSNAEGESVCIGSVDELEKLCGQKVNDLHIDTVDDIEIPSPTGKSPLTRTQGILDCWFESGSMPYAQWGYPKTNSDKLEKSFPAEFIAEGIDQTRGWFYSSTVLSSALFDKPFFKNVIVNGMILAEDGKKMSKSLKNYPDPTKVLHEHGADALRLYLIDSPVVRGQELRFSEKGLKDIVRKISLRWWNAYSFFVNYANVDEFVPKGEFKSTPNILDQWVLSKLNSLILQTNEQMEAYRIYAVVPSLLQFIEDLTNTYIRFNRRHFWQEEMPADKSAAYETLYYVLTMLSKVMAPFTPFMADATYKNLSLTNPKAKESVHLEDFPKSDTSLINKELESSVERMKQLVLMGRNLREKMKVRAKIPLKELTIIHREQEVLDSLKKLETYFVDELNVQKVTYNSNEDDLIQVTAKADFKVLGKKLGKKMKPVAQKIQNFDLETILKLEAGETLEVEGENITKSDVEIRRAPKTGGSEYLISDQLISIELDSTVTNEQIQEGLSREVIRRIQVARKNADLNLDDRIELELHCSGDLISAVEKHKSRIQNETLAVSLKCVPQPNGEFQEQSDIDGESLMIAFSRNK